jgi:hypothetical protein
MVSVPRRVTGFGLVSEAYGFRLLVRFSIVEVVDGVLPSVINPN